MVVVQVLRQPLIAALVGVASVRVPVSKLVAVSMVKVSVSVVFPVRAIPIVPVGAAAFAVLSLPFTKEIAVPTVVSLPEKVPFTAVVMSMRAPRPKLPLLVR